MEKIEILPEPGKKEIILADSDFALYQTLQELIAAIKTLTGAIRRNG